MIDMMEVNGGNDYKFDIWENKVYFVNLGIIPAAFMQLLKHCKKTKCLLGMEAKFTMILVPATALSNKWLFLVCKQCDNDNFAKMCLSI
jgi:hypothetical protein